MASRFEEMSSAILDDREAVPPRRAALCVQAKGSRGVIGRVETMYQFWNGGNAGAVKSFAVSAELKGARPTRRMLGNMSGLGQAPPCRTPSMSSIAILNAREGP